MKFRDERDNSLKHNNLKVPKTNNTYNFQYLIYKFIQINI